MICVDDLHLFVVKNRFPHIKTPAINKLKEEGIYFSNAVCNTPVCNPSRSSFFSGLYPHTTGAYLNGSDGWNRSEILKKIHNIPECFRDNGYITWGAGKILHNPLST
jgi:arylsulfatase A-like enzyme